MKKCITFALQLSEKVMLFFPLFRRNIFKSVFYIKFFNLRNYFS